jgi:hypothetical protein
LTGFLGKTDGSGLPNTSAIERRGVSDLESAAALTLARDAVLRRDFGMVMVMEEMTML